MAVDQNSLRIAIRNNLNETLIERKKLSEKAVKYIVDLQVSMHGLHAEMRKVSLDCDNKKLKELAAQVTEIQYLLQSTWGLAQDKKYHKFWELPGCTCKVFENINIYPSEEYIYSSICPIHGTKCK